MESPAEKKAAAVASGQYRNMQDACDSAYGTPMDPISGKGDTAPDALPKTPSPHSFTTTTGTTFTDGGSNPY